MPAISSAMVWTILLIMLGVSSKRIYPIGVAPQSRCAKAIPFAQSHTHNA
jgi:predicted membrane protein